MNCEICKKYIKVNEKFEVVKNGAICRMHGKDIDYKEMMDTTFGKDCTFENSSNSKG